MAGPFAVLSCCRPGTYDAAMPSDTVLVALLGVVATLGSLTIQGWLNRGAEKRRYEREERHRIEDRHWEIDRRNSDERHKLHSELIRTARNLDSAVGDLCGTLTPEKFTRAREAVLQFETLIAEADTVVVHWAVSQTGSELSINARKVIYDADLIDANDPDAAEKHMGLVKQSARVLDLRYELIRACRRDLGLAVDGE